MDYEAIKGDVDGMRSTTTSDFAESRFLNNYRFVQLRGDLEQKLGKAMETVTKFFKEENDFLYKRGEAKSEERKNHLFAQKALIRNRLPMNKSHD